MFFSNLIYLGPASPPVGAAGSAESGSVMKRFLPTVQPPGDCTRFYSYTIARGTVAVSWDKVDHGYSILESKRPIVFMFLFLFYFCLLFLF